MAGTTYLELVRFGFGPTGADTPAEGAPDPDRLLAQLDAPEDVPLASATADRLEMLLTAQADIARLKQEAQRLQSTEKPMAPPSGVAVRALVNDDVLGFVTAPVLATQGFRERLVYFWLNRLTVGNRNNDNQYFLLPYRDEAIRPHVAGRFADMLAASAWHPAMLLYLDQAASSGPDSVLGKRRKTGLNENFAREFLELHSMGTGYTQTDVTELARLFTGMIYRRAGGARYAEAAAQPGEKTILGTRYTTGEEEIARLIQTVARRPETAQSVARALARHFLAPDPPEDLVARMAEAYLAADTALPPVYRLLLEHPAAADPALQKVRSPLEYVAASMRALQVPVDAPKLRLGLQMRGMGQNVFRPVGPDGWHEAADTWISGPSIAARLKWAEMLARGYAEGVDPRRLAPVLLAPSTSGDTIRAAAQAEQRWEGVAVLLGSPDFMRR